MAHSAPGKHYRDGLSAFELFEMFPDEDSAHRWFEGLLWPNVRECPRCESTRTREVKNRKPMPYWCSDCRRYFSVKIGTIMEASNLPLRKWVVALYLLSTNLKGVSSMKLHRDLGVSQKTAWMMAQKIRECWLDNLAPLSGEVEVDETYIGGKEKNKHMSQRPFRLAGTEGKTPVIGAKQRNGLIIARPIRGVGKHNIREFVYDAVAPGATMYTDDLASYRKLANVEHKAVKHSVGQYVDGAAHTNGIESFWSMLKRGYTGTYHKMSVKHLHRYVNEFAGRANVRELDTLTQMAVLALGMRGKRARWQDLTA